MGRRASVVALGDSNTALPSLPAGHPDRWPERVGRQLGIKVKTLARDGRTIADAYDKGLVDHALTAGAHFVTIGFAVDSCLKLPLAEFSGLLDQLLYQVETTVATPLLMTGVWLDYPPDVPTDRCEESLQPVNDAIRSAANDRGVRLLDVAARMEKQALRSAADPRMPLTVAGSRMIGHMVVQAIRTGRVSNTPTTLRLRAVR